MSRKTVNRKPVNRKPVNRKPVTRKPATRKPVTRKPVTRKPVTRKLVNRKPAEPEPGSGNARRTGMRTGPSMPRARRVAATLASVVLSGALVAGCETGGITVGSSADPSSSGSVSPTAEPPSGEGSNVDGARLLYFDKLPISAADYPGTEAPFAARVDNVRDFATKYSGTPGIEAVVNALAKQQIGDDELFVFLMQPCVADDVSLVLHGDTVTAKVHNPGGAVVRCEPPPIRIAVFAVPNGAIADSVRPMPPSS
jgi:hypothetical protein